MVQLDGQPAQKEYLKVENIFFVDRLTIDTIIIKP